jgi:hypothetical protein
MRCCLNFVASLLKRMVVDAALRHRSIVSLAFWACGENTLSKPFPQGKGVNTSVTPTAGSFGLPTAVMPFAAVGFAFG